MCDLYVFKINWRYFELYDIFLILMKLYDN